MFSILVRKSVDKVLTVSPCTNDLLKCYSMEYAMGKKTFFSLGKELSTWRWPDNSSKISLVWVDMPNTAFLKLVGFLCGLKRVIC